MHAGSFITFTSSVAGFLGVFGFTSYSPSKFALIGFAEALNQEVAARGIRVAVLCPPDTDTPGFEEENITKPYETRALSGTAKLMSAQEVAEVFLKQLERGRFIITCNSESAILYRLQGIAPNFARRYMLRMIRKIQQHKRGGNRV
jgi:short-subunit dehydrogenase